MLYYGSQICFLQNLIMLYKITEYCEWEQNGSNHPLHTYKNIALLGIMYSLGYISYVYA